MLIAVTVMPIIFGMLADVPEDTPPAAAPASAATTFIVIAALALRATGAWRLWMPLIGLVAGCVVASFFGLYDTAERARSAMDRVPRPAAGPASISSSGPRSGDSSRRSSS